MDRNAVEFDIFGRHYSVGLRIRRRPDGKYVDTFSITYDDDNNKSAFSKGFSTTFFSELISDKIKDSWTVEEVYRDESGGLIINLWKETLLPEPVKEKATFKLYFKDASDEEPYAYDYSVKRY